MRVPLSWLRDYVDLDLDPESLAARLTERGMEVKSIERTGGEWAGVVVGRLLSVERHPNADKLWVTRVDVGGEAPLQVVCGANNIAPGQLVPVATVGTVLPGERTIGRTTIRGVESQGMLCSPDELRSGDDADGIQILGTGEEFPLGIPVAEAIGEVILDVDVKPNRGDALSMVGLAREIAAFSGATLRLPAVSLVEAAELVAADQVTVSIEQLADCPRFTARLFDGVHNAESPRWMQRRLLAAGMRPISAVVDITNYVMHEFGQPMHAYDANRVPDGRMVVRRGQAGERLTTIDHVERTLDDGMLVIADGGRAIGLAGIMGGADTEVTAATTRVILESAVFHGPLIRNTARRLALRSEASQRHEKGIGTDLPRLAADRAAALLAEVSGARIATGIVDNDPPPHPPRWVEVEVGRVARLLGLPIAIGDLEGLLGPLGFTIETVSADRVRIGVPPHRLDVVAMEDVAEEIARSYGYARIEGRLPSGAAPPHRLDPGEPRHRVRRVLAGLGLDELVSHALIGAEDLARSGFPAQGEHLVRVANPLAEQHSILRPVIYPSILAALAENARLRRDAAWLFEVGKTYRHAGSGSLPSAGEETAGTGRHEAWTLGIGLMGARSPRSLDGRAGEADVADLKGVIDALHVALGLPLPNYRAEAATERHPHLHPGRAGRIVDATGRSYGSVGEVHPEIAAAWDLPGRPVIAALHLARMLSLAGGSVRAVAVPAAQPIDRDLAIAVADGLPVGDLLREVRGSAGPLLVDLRLFDVYRGPQLGAGRVSYALALRFQPETAADEHAVDRALHRVATALREKLGAEIR